MLFNSYEFIFLFLPLVLIIYYAIARKGTQRSPIIFLIIASFCFYAYWNPMYLALFAISIFFNFYVAKLISKVANQSLKKNIFILGILINLLTIFYYKYFNFLLDLTAPVFKINSTFTEILLPLGISFFTFQQIAYLIDTFQGKVNKHHFLEYCLFVSFFPQLIAGPIIHYKEIIPQFQDKSAYVFNLNNFSVGLTIFVFGLFKKVIIADSLALTANSGFNSAELGNILPAFEAWSSVLSYTLQIYFDFSGYSDMAIGLARMFGIFLPLNFNSPYKSKCIIEFWRSWHMTLSRFLRDYVYISLGGSRKGIIRRYSNLLITMIIGGIWHGAGVNFILWGTLHGMFLLINHGWRYICKNSNLFQNTNVFVNLIYHCITFVSIAIAWIFFRAKSFDGANNMLISLGNISFVELITISKYYTNDLILMFVSLLIVFIAPNTQQMMYNFKPALETSVGQVKVLRNSLLYWKPNFVWGVLIFFMAYRAFISLNNKSDFLYFNF
jgi:alginate O-acetyltransferase complex protein AlgI